MEPPRTRSRRAAAGSASTSLTGAELAASRESFDGVLGRIVSGSRSGDFHAEPDKQACKWCDFDAVCDIGRNRQTERKAEDERRVSFAQMREIE